jgi:hypothetical protein
VRRLPMYVGGMGSARRSSTNTNRSMAGWNLLTQSDCGFWRTRTASSKSCWLNRCWTMLCCETSTQKMVTPAVRREAVVHLCEAHGVSQRRACDVLEIDRSTVRYLSRRGDDAELRVARKTLDEWQEDYNWRRPHSALENMTPMEFLQRKAMDKMAA